ncbi:MAG: GEGP motif-containing diheme protein [Syntrophobacter sp.]
MRKFSMLVAVSALMLFAVMISTATAAYHHAGESEKDATIFLNVYPDAAGTKLDNCALCHGGGQDPNTAKTSILGSCQYCHAVSQYGAVTGKYGSTLNAYGAKYASIGRTEASLRSIEGDDSDGDGYSNLAEIIALRYPGDAKDDPSKVPAPSRVFTKAKLEAMPQHSQFMLMNTTKSGDYYTEYSGVRMDKLLKAAGIRSEATKITVYAPDGYSISHPLEDDPLNTGATYAPYVKGKYPQATYYYDAVADAAVVQNPDIKGWCDYSSPGTTGLGNGDPIYVRGGLRMLLALRAEGKDLVPGYLDSTNKLASGTEGPFRTVTPQKLIGPPDQPSNNSNSSLIWPYDKNAEHNAGFSSKSATIIKVEPLPEGTTDIDVMEAGWNYVDTGKIVIYGNIDPTPNILNKLADLTSVVWKADRGDFKRLSYKLALLLKIQAVRQQVARNHYKSGLMELQRDILPKIESCNQTGKRVANNWISDCDLQQSLYWSIQEIITLLNIVV